MARPSSEHDAEEECLFFVGLSRARDYLSLSRAERYTTQNASPSRFLGSVSRLVTVGRHDGSGRTFVQPAPRSPQPALDVYPERELSLYIDCPARYRYEVVEKLRGARDESPYIQFHRCVYITVGWLEAEHEGGRTADLAAGLARLRAEWDARGPRGHGFEAYYWRAAVGMVTAMAQAIAGEVGTYERLEWKVSVGTAHVSVTPDRVFITPEGIVRVQRNRTGRKTQSEPDNRLYALLRRGASQKYSDRTISIETFYLATGEIVVVPTKNEDKKVQDYVTAIDAIEAGDFPAKPEQRHCPNCQCYFTCGD